MLEDRIEASNKKENKKHWQPIIRSKMLNIYISIIEA